MVYRPSKISGFTLIELAAVLTIVALLFAAIAGGRSLLQGAQVRSVVLELSNLKNALYLFDEKYGALPGDMPDADTYWVGVGNADTHDGRIIFPQESYLAWQHLALSNIIPGSYSGIGNGAGNDEADIGENVPASDIEGAGFSLVSLNAGDAALLPSITDNNNYLVFGAETNGATPYTFGEVLSPRNARSVDQKIDDGEPESGELFPHQGQQTGAADTCADNSSPKEYNLDLTDALCGFYYISEIKY